MIERVKGVFVMKAIHLADMHLDQPFEGLGKLPPHLLAELVQQHEKMINQVVEAAISEDVDVVLIVGDTFHQPVVTIQTQQILINAMSRLKDHQIPVVMSFGNHDYYTPDTYWFEFPDNVVLLTEQAVSTHYLTTKRQERVAISGFSYQERWINESMVSEFPVRDSQVAFHLGMYHGQQGQSQANQQYAPFSLTEMKEKGYDYWALGHIHQPTVVSTEPLIIYPGSPLGHSKKETNSSGFLIVESGEKEWSYQWQALKQVAWLSLSVELSQVTTIKELMQQLLTGLRESQSEAEIKFVSIQLLGLNFELEQSLELELRNGGLLNYLQSEIGTTGALVWPYEIKRQLEAASVALPLGVTRELMTQLSHRYLEEDAFNDLMKELYRQADLSRLVDVDAEVRRELVTEAEELLVRELGGERDDH